MFAGSGRRRGFVRTHISPAERWISWSILGLIAAVGLAVYLKGQSYDPALFSLDPALLPAGEQAQTPGPATAPAPAVAAVQPASPLESAAPLGWQLLGPIERFTPADLYEKIDGRADQYLAYDMVGMSCASLAPGADSKRYVEVFVYDLGAPERAFGIYSVERPAERSAVELGREGYRTGASLFFWKGQYYLQVIPSEADQALEAGGLALAGQLAGQLPDSGESLWGLSAFPKAGLVPGSVQYFLRDALNLDFLTHTYTAQYRAGDLTLTGFLSRQDSPQAASQTLDGYLKYIAEYGKLLERREEAGAVQATGDLGGFFEVVWQRGTLIGGVSGAAERGPAERLAQQLRRDAKA